MSRGFSSSYRTTLLAGFVFAMFAGLGVRLVWLHVIDRDVLLRSVADARLQIIPENARRGDIVDAKGALLATSEPVIMLGVDPQSLHPGDEAKWPRLAALIGMPLERLRTILTTRFQPAAAAAARAVSPVSDAGGLAFHFGATAQVPTAATPVMDSEGESAADDEPDDEGHRPIRWAKLSDQISESTYSEIVKLNIRGLCMNRVYRRDYPDRDLAAHVIGYVDHEERPVAGMEHYADFFLRGERGWRVSEKDPFGRELAQFRSRDVPACDGYSVKLSINAAVQRMAEDELAHVAQKYDPAKATIIVSDARTGFILALANYPSFDLNQYNQIPRGDQARMRNVAVADEYEPGSVFKIVAVSGALNEGLVTPSSTFDCTLEKIEYNGTMRSLPREDASDHFDHPLTVAEIISHSSNKGTDQLAMELGDRRFYDYARAFGFGQDTGFPVGGETAGSLKPPGKWDSLTITRMPIGQSVACSALQMHQAMCVIASGGLLLRPQIIRQISDAQGNVVYGFADAVAVRRVITTSTARTMAHLLTGVTGSDGTAPEAAIPGYEVAGKTATAQKLLPVQMASGRTELRYSTAHHVASFIGFFPATRPQVVISVIVDDADARCPGHVAYGGKVAAPVFKHLGERLISYLDIPPPTDNPMLRTLAMEGGRW